MQKYFVSDEHENIEINNNFVILRLIKSQSFVFHDNLETHGQKLLQDRFPFKLVSSHPKLRPVCKVIELV